MTVVQLLAESDDERDALPVLMSAPLRPGCDRAHISRYGDPAWDLAPGVFRDNARRCHGTVHFGGIEDPSIADALRQILHARLNVDLPGHRSRLEPAGVRGEANRTLRFFDFVKAQLGRFDLGRVDQALVDRYAGSLRLAGQRPVVAAALLRIVLGHPDRKHAGTPTGDGILLRLLSGEPLDSLRCDTGLLAAIWTAKPRTDT